jgi:hypothetical protein
VAGLTSILNFISGLSIVAGIIAGLVTLIGVIYFYVLLRPASDYTGETDEAATNRETYGLRRTNLATGKTFAGWYDGLLDTALARVDRFFGDEPGPKTQLVQYWSGPALDRCLLLALIYPVATLLVVWHVTGQVGPLETALDLPADATGRERALSGASLAAMMATAIWWGAGLRAQLGFRASMIRFAAFAFAGAGAFTVAFAFAVAVAVAGAVAFAFAGAFAVAFAGAVSWIGTHRPRWHIPALLVFCAFLLGTSAGVVMVSGSDEDLSGLLLLLFFAVLPVLNALFDWFSLGVTRFLLRRGQVRGASAALGYAALDLVIAFFVLIILTAVCVMAVTGMNVLVGQTVFDITALLNQLDEPATRFAPNTWWVYVTVFTTLLPSLCNVALGILALGRAGMGGLNRWVVDHALPESPTALTFSKRVLASMALTCQWVVASFVATAVVGALTLIFFYAVQLVLGPSLLEMAWWAHDAVGAL